MLRLTHLHYAGIKGEAREHNVALSRLLPHMRSQTVAPGSLDARTMRSRSRSGLVILLGPNGSGKSSMLAAITYALRGKIPGLKASESDAVLADGAFASLEASSVDGAVTLKVERSTKKRRTKHSAVAWLDKGARSEEADGQSQTALFVEKHFGPGIDTDLNAFDPTESVWSLSSEKRLRWIFGLLAEKSGWTVERLAAAMPEMFQGDKIDKTQTPTELVEDALAVTEEELRHSKTSVKEYETILAGLTDKISEPSATEIELAESAAKLAHERRDKATKTLYETQAKRRAWDEASRKLEWYNANSNFPLQLERKTEELEALEARCLEIQTRLETQRAEGIALTRQMQLERAKLEELGARHRCPTCDTALLAETLAEVEQKITTRIADANAAFEKVSLAANDAHAEHMKASSERAVARRGREGLLAEIEKRKDIGEQAESYKKLLAEPYPAEEVAQAALDEAKVSAEHAQNAVRELYRRQGLAKERATKKQLADKATAHRDATDSLVGRLKNLRATILLDAQAAAKAALTEHEHALAPHGGRWLFDVERGFDIGYLAGDDYVGFKALSAGEKVLATTALLAAVHRLKPAPWSVIFIDNAEVCSVGSTREKLIAYLVALADRGEVGNVFVSSSDSRVFSDEKLAATATVLHLGR